MIPAIYPPPSAHPPCLRRLHTVLSTLLLAKPRLAIRWLAALLAAPLSLTVLAFALSQNALSKEKTSATQPITLISRIKNQDMPALANELAIVRNMFIESSNDRNIDQLMRCFHDDATYTVASVEVVGKEKIRTSLEYIKNFTSILNLTENKLELVEEGNVLEEGVYFYKITNPYQIEFTQKYVLEWKKVGSTWLILNYKAEEPILEMPTGYFDQTTDP